MRRRVLSWIVMALTACSAVQGQVRTQDRSDAWRWFPTLQGSADWEIYRSDGSSQGTRTTYDAFRQRYSLDLSGVLWDPRFNRYAIGVDFFRHDARSGDQSIDTNSLGYRATTTFFPQRTFPLRLFARRSSLDASSASLADSDRETAAWGADWTVMPRQGQRLALQFDRTSYDLVSPVALRERRSNGTLDFNQSTRRSETSIRYGLQDQKELVRGSSFERRSLQLHERARFDNGIGIFLSGGRTLSDALFSNGQRDDLTIDRMTGVLDFQGKDGFGAALSYDFNTNEGMFVDSVSHTVNARATLPVGLHWSATVASTAGRVQSTTPTDEIRQEIGGVSGGIRYGREWGSTSLGASYAFGLNRAALSNGPDRSVTSHSADLEVRSPFVGDSRIFSSLAYRQDQNDTSGVGFAFDEARATIGVESPIGRDGEIRGSIYRRDATYDTFQFGVQDSTETGLEASYNTARGGATFGVERTEGISDFFPDPAAGSPFLPGTDLVNRSRAVNIGFYWRLPRNLRLRAQARREARWFTSIGEEDIVFYRPEVEWTVGAWALSLGLTHYARDNDTNFAQDTLLLKIQRRFF